MLFKVAGFVDAEAAKAGGGLVKLHGAAPARLTRSQPLSRAQATSTQVQALQAFHDVGLQAAPMHQSH